ncbi:MAG: hypothetical protein R8N23_07430 [Reichenbachiella sp.]|uniref:hypothetical protein n=1 Tax=Reichenbachiella sp. TaxID=2184521 RepID=UPI0029663A5E|nr:hypothetical protein [Reichenbachiella sp.]MDW3209680.1 hypothetical protein [Reichenbachiella sp.]
MKSSLLKLGIFLLTMLAFYVALKNIKLDQQVVESKTEFSTKALIDVDNTSLFFIGSSRVQRAIDPHLLESELKNYSINNLGISGSTFLGNCVVADHILRLPGKKVIFIELSPLKHDIPSGVFKFGEVEKFNVLSKVFQLTENLGLSTQLMLVLDVLNTRMFSQISLKNDVKRIFRYKQSIEKDNQWIGYRPTNLQSRDKLIRFLRSSDVEDSCFSNYKLYIEMINDLDELASFSDGEIVFFLPLTYLKETEVRIATDLFAILPERMKLRFSDRFIQSCSSEDYMADKNHFNKKGATNYSKGMIHQIQNYFQEKNKKENSNL